MSEGKRAPVDWHRLVLMALLIGIGAGVFAATTLARATAALATGLAAQAALCWRYLGTRGRLTLAMIAGFPAASVAQYAGLLPPGRMMALAAGGGLAGFFALWLAVHKALGRRRWRRRGPVVVHGGCEHEQRLELVEARQREMDLRVKDMFALMTRAAEDAVPWPDHETTVQFPRLTAVADEPGDAEAG